MKPLKRNLFKEYFFSVSILHSARQWHKSQNSVGECPPLVSVWKLVCSRLEATPIVQHFRFFVAPQVSFFPFGSFLSPRPICRFHRVLFVFNFRAPYFLYVWVYIEDSEFSSNDLCICGMHSSPVCASVLLFWRQLHIRNRSCPSGNRNYFCSWLDIIASALLVDVCCSALCI